MTKKVVKIGELLPLLYGDERLYISNEPLNKYNCQFTSNNLVTTWANEYMQLYDLDVDILKISTYRDGIAIQVKIGDFKKINVLQ